ncbi:MAG: hypothetical protein FWE06_03095 [Oscillospiraceae bacterium]|nr:hypothetical protein [Oscillospiraceae bacterium]
MCFEWDVFWSALSSIATIIAVITAFAIVRYDHKINNRKRIKIDFKHMTGQITYDGFREGRTVDSILIKFINTGNRKVIIDGIKFSFPDGHSYSFLYLLADNEQDMKLPCVLEIEEARQMIIPLSHFVRLAKHAKELNRLNEEIVIIATDTAEKEYCFKTGITYKIYFDMEDETDET